MENKTEQEIKDIGNIYKKETKKRVIKSLGSNLITIIIEIVFIILLKMEILKLNNDEDNFYSNLIFYILIIVIAIQVIMSIYIFFKFQFPLIKKDDYQIGLYKLNLEKQNKERISSNKD